MDEKLFKEKGSFNSMITGQTPICPGRLCDTNERSKTAINGTCAAACTLAVSIVGHLDLQASQTSIPVELTVISVGLTIAATH